MAWPTDKYFCPACGMLCGLVKGEVFPLPPECDYAKLCPARGFLDIKLRSDKFTCIGSGGPTSRQNVGARKVSIDSTGE